MPRNFECKQPNYRLERMPKALAALRGTVTRLLSKAVAGLAKTGGAVSLRAPVLQNLTAFCQLRVPPGRARVAKENGSGEAAAAILNNSIIHA